MISLIRIDDRLIHGQVMAVWARALRLSHILVADDDSAADAFTRQVMHLAMPPAIALSIVGIDESSLTLMTAQTDSTRTLVLLKSVAAATRLYGSYHYRILNVGGIGMAPGRKLVWKSIAASAAELEQLKALRDSGVDVYLQLIPGDEKLPIARLDG